MPAFDPFLHLGGVKANDAPHSGGVNFQMGDGSVRFARDTDDSFTFTAAPDVDEALLLPAVQAAREAARAGDGSVKPGDGSVKPGDGSVMPGDGSVKLGDGSVMPQDEKGIIAILIGLMDRRATAYEEGRYEDAVGAFGQADVDGVAGALSDGWSIDF